MQVVDREAGLRCSTRLITRFRELTGVPLVLNTSFNDQEPLVATPDDALKNVRADRTSMPSFWEIALSDERDDGRGPAPTMRDVGVRRSPARSRERRACFEPVRDRYGWRLALVFGNHAPGGVCPYYAAERCFHCDIGAGEGAAFDLTTNRQRLAWFREHYRRTSLRSATSFSTIPARFSIRGRCRRKCSTRSSRSPARFPAVRVISLDSREAYIRPELSGGSCRSWAAGITVRPILGIESADDRIRNEILQKAMPRAAIDRVFQET